MFNQTHLRYSIDTPHSTILEQRVKCLQGSFRVKSSFYSDKYNIQDKFVFLCLIVAKNSSYQENCYI